MKMEKKKEKENKEYMVIIPDEVQKKIDESPVADEVEEVIQKLMKGEFVGDKTELVECEQRLICCECRSKNISWMIDENNKEVYFKCLDCRESGWMPEKEYKEIIKQHPHFIIKD